MPLSQGFDRNLTANYSGFQTEFYRQKGCQSSSCEGVQILKSLTVRVSHIGAYPVCALVNQVWPVIYQTWLWHGMAFYQLYLGRIYRVKCCRHTETGHWTDYWGHRPCLVVFAQKVCHIKLQGIWYKLVFHGHNLVILFDNMVWHYSISVWDSMSPKQRVITWWATRPCMVTVTVQLINSHLSFGISCWYHL